MEKRKNHIQYRYYVKGKLKILSPLIIASGEDELADLQLIRDWDGNIIIPGTTLAGNIRHLLQEKIKDKKIMDQYFGSEAENSGHSLFSFFDASALSVDTDIRDGVKLDNLTKTTKDKSKYDYEIINTGSVFEFRMEAVSRKNSDNIIVEAILSEIIELLEKSVLRIGAKTSRGFGRIQLAQTKTLKLEMAKDQDKQKWINFSWNDLNTKDEFKTVSLTSNEKTVVSGTSWNGAIRHALENAGRELGKHEEMLKLIHKTFGWVDDENRIKKAVPS